MSVPKKLINYLQQKKVKYETVEHKTVFTAWDLAQTMHVKPKEIMKTVVVKLNGKEPALVLLTADQLLDKKKFLNAVNAWISAPRAPETAVALKEKLHGKARSLEFADERWLREKVVGKPGATPPFGEVLKMTVFADRQALTPKVLLLNSGSYEVSIKMPLSEFQKLGGVMIAGRFSVPRKK